MVGRRREGRCLNGRHATQVGDLKRACPKCTVFIGWRCVRLTGLRQPMKTVHEERKADDAGQAT